MSQLTQNTLSQDSQFDNDDLAEAQAVVDGGGLNALQDPALYQKLYDDNIQLLALLPQTSSVRVGSNSEESEVLVNCNRRRNGDPVFMLRKSGICSRYH